VQSFVSSVGLLSMAGYRKILPRTSDYWEACARHTSRQAARTLQTGYYCDRCARLLTNRAFNDRPPVYHGPGIKGFCGLCNKRRKVYLRQWFACGICWNVIVAYQKSIVASQAVHDYWREEIVPKFSHLSLVEREAVSLSPYSRKARTKRQSAESLTELDFAVMNRKLKRQKLLFHIELKSGPGAINEMREFQLDINDSNDIIGVANNTRRPVYIFHVQTEFRYDPPTRASVARKIWWTDMFKLLDHRMAVRTRRGEDKRAGYYSPAAFQGMDTFPEELLRKQYRKLQKRLRRHRLKFT
jgi:hypothetical protein